MPCWSVRTADSTASCSLPLTLHLWLLACTPSFQSCPPFITLKRIITILCVCLWCFISMSLFMFRLLEYSLAIRQNLICSLRYYCPSGCLCLEMFHDLFFACFMAPSFLCYIFLTFLFSNYFGISVIPSYSVRKEAVLF